MKYSNSKLLLAFAASCLLAMVGSPLYGQKSFSLNFNDPNDDRLSEILTFGNSEIREDGGVGDTGYLSVTDALNGQRGAIAFPDFSDPPKSKLESFRITADLRVGAGTARPADGFSFNLIRPEDPLIADLIDEDTFQLEEGSIGAYAASPAGEGNLPEEGSQTGLGIGFDEWQSGGADPEATATDCGSVEFDCVGMSIRVDNELVFQAPFPTLNGENSDQTSLQTGPRGDVEDLGWSTLDIRLTPDPEGRETHSHLKISYKNRVVIDEAIEYVPSPGLLFFGGRTGGANAAHHIDNIQIITDFTKVGLVGDFNKDEVLDIADFNLMIGNMNTEDRKYEEGDINFDGKINFADFVSFRKEWGNRAAGAAASVPEPATALMALFGLLGIAGFRRRR